MAGPEHTAKGAKSAVSQLAGWSVVKASVATGAERTCSGLQGRRHGGMEEGDEYRHT